MSDAQDSRVGSMFGPYHPKGCKTPGKPNAQHYAASNAA